MITNIRKHMIDMVEQVDWLDDSTRAFAKLKVGGEKPVWFNGIAFISHAGGPQFEPRTR